MCIRDRKNIPLIYLQKQNRKREKACLNNNQQVIHHFEDILEMISLGKTAQRKVETLKRLKRLNNPNN